MDRMSPLDASFLYIEDARSHMHIGSVAIFEGPPPAYDEIVAQVEAKLPLLPRYRQKVRFVPFDLSRPVWVDDPRFNLGYHVRHTAMPAPGDEEHLRRLVGRLMSQQLDRHKPLWEMWVAEGLSGGTLGADLQDPPLHGRRGLGHRPAHRPARRGARAGAARRSSRSGTPGPNRARRSCWPEPCPSGSPTRSRGSARPGGWRLPRGGSPARRSTRSQGLVAMRGLIPRTPASSLNGPDRAAPAVGVGASAPVGREDGSRGRSAARSTTSCSPSSPTASARCFSRAARTSRTVRSGRSSRSRCAAPASAAPTTTASRRCSPSCRWGSPTRSPAWTRSTRRWTTSRTPSRRWPVRCSPRFRASLRRCCWRSARDSPPTPRSATSTRSRPTSPDRSARSTRPAGGCSSPSPTSRSRGACASGSRSSPTTAG